MNSLLCISDLVEATAGRLRLAVMPPRDGELTAVGRIVLSAAAVNEGDVYWRLDSRPGDVEQAFLLGAAGIVTAGPAMEPWPGRFCLVVDDSVAALAGFVDWLAASAEETFAESSELKVLQLCGAYSADIYRLTCGREVKDQRVNHHAATNHATPRCRRHAA
jgi:hypothetical protein